MAVRIGKIELTGVQNLHTEEARALVEQRVPEQQGSVFQDLGREPLNLLLEGLLFSEEALSSLEKLRQAQQKAEALSFAADVVVGSDLTEVIIEDLRVRQIAGYAHRYRYSLRLREYLRPPQPANAALAPVNAGIQADADAWGADSLAAAQALQDPASLPGLLEKQPGLLNQLDPKDLGASIAQNSGLLSGKDFSGILKAIGKIDPAKVIELIQAVKDAGSLGAFIQKYADEGLDFLSDLTGVDLSKAASLVRALAGGVEFIQKLKTVGERAGKLVHDIGQFDPIAEVRPLFDKASS
jgi:hypothetical protein